jgi:hypothetical protein
MRPFIARVLFAAVTFAGSARGAEPDFAKWWPQFQAAVARSDAPAVAQGARFPMSWENGPVREIHTKDDLTARFDSYFTPEIRKMVAKGKPERLPTHEYILLWKARGNEYSLYFVAEGDGFRLHGLSEGPP